MDSARRILVVGASGQVGAQLRRLLPPGSVLPTSRRAEKPGWTALDLATLSEAEAEELVQRYQITTVYCAGGMTHVDGCESSPELAHRINCEGPAILALAAGKCGAGFRYFSWRFFFSGRRGPYVAYAP